MKSKTALLLVASVAAPALSACIPAPKVQEASKDVVLIDACDANGVQDYIGKRFTATLAEQMRKKAGAAVLRTGPENGPVTMDYQSARLNVFYDEAMLISMVNCG